MSVDDNLFSSNPEDACQEYKEWQKSRSETCKEISDFYSSNKKYLDNNFSGEFPKDFFSRLLELFILKKIRESKFSNKLELKSKKNKVGPDFKINNFFENKNLYIECVCPKPAEKSFKEGTFEIKEEINGNRISSISSGLDYHSITRFTSILRDKAIKFEGYLKKKIIRQEDYKMLCVLTYHISQEKAKLYNTSSRTSTSTEFCAAIFGDENHFFEKETGKHVVEYNKLKIKNIDVGFQEYLGVFDIIVSCNILPFFSSSTCAFDFFYGSEKIIFELKNKFSRQFFS